MRKFILPAVLLIALVTLAACGDDDDEDVPLKETRTPSGQTPSPAPDGPPEVEGESTTTGSGLEYIKISEGDGAQPTADSTVVVHYTGYLESNGLKFDSSVDRGQPATFRAGDLIPGFTEGLLLTKAGGKARLIIPPDIGYGPNGAPQGGIPGNATLIFDIELVEVR